MSFTEGIQNETKLLQATISTVEGRIRLNNQVCAKLLRSGVGSNREKGKSTRADEKEAHF